MKAAARRSLTAAAAGTSGQVRPFRLIAVLLLLIIAIPGATTGVIASDVLLTAVPPLDDSYRFGAIAERGEVLSPLQLRWAATRYRQLSVAGRGRLDALLGTVSTGAQGYVLKAFAAGHPLDELAGFAEQITGRTPQWMRTHLSLLDPAESGPVDYRGYRVRQYDDTSCGSTSIVVAHALIDPMYALMLTTGGHPGTADEAGRAFLARLRAEEQRVHHATNLLWPRLVGTPPWGLRDLLNQPAMALGGQYRWTVTEEWVSGSVRAVVRQALAAVAQGYPVPVLIGDAIPRHYVLLVHYDTAGALFFEPTSGEVRRVSAVSLRGLDFHVLGYPHLHGLIVPGPL